ncbi:MAG: hypothetical protein AAB582_01070 [Patescibacteria group bacterium]
MTALKHTAAQPALQHYTVPFLGAGTADKLLELIRDHPNRSVSSETVGEDALRAIKDTRFRFTPVGAERIVQTTPRELGFAVPKLAVEIVMGAQGQFGLAPCPHDGAVYTMLGVPLKYGRPNLFLSSIATFNVMQEEDRGPYELGVWEFERPINPDYNVWFLGPQ